MSGPGDSDSANGVPDDAAGVLANLPRTRPQRSSPRRAAARATAQRPATPAAGTQKPAAKRARATGAKGAKAAPETAAKPARPARTSAAKPAARPARGAPKRVPAPDPVPRQGYETEGERAYGPVAPPGGGDVLATAAEAVIELARAGISGGERLVRDLFSRLPGA